jgi:hypothetical protein
MFGVSIRRSGVSVMVIRGEFVDPFIDADHSSNGCKRNRLLRPHNLRKAAIIVAKTGENQLMPTFVIEREIPGAGRLTADQLRQIAEKSNDVVAGLGVPYKWITSYVAGDKIYCVHEAPSAEIVLNHAREGGFPANKVTEVAAFMDPSTAASS